MHLSLDRAEETKLPSSRALADQLGVARLTVEDAFVQLADGYVEGRRGSGAYVASVVQERAPDRPTQAGAEPVSHAPPARPWTPWAERLSDLRIPVDLTPARSIDFRQGMPAIDEFPHQRWNRLRNRVMRQLGPAAFHYGPVAGEPVLRTALSAYLARSRALRAEAERIVITSGAQQCLDLLTRLLVRPGDTVVFEDPGYPAARRVFQAAGAVVIPAPVDGHGLVVDALDDLAGAGSPPRIVYVTPSHQYPTGALMPLSRRMALLRWARRHGVLVIEDDYDGEFRYGARPVEALATLDAVVPGPGVVAYMGAFSKVIYPALRLGYLVPPSDLVDLVVAAKAIADRHSPRLEQQTIAAFIAEGEFERHLGRMRKLYDARRRALLDGLAAELSKFAHRDPATTAAGLHLLVTFDVPLTEEDVIRRAAGVGVHLDPASPCYVSPPSRPTVMIGYAPAPEELIREGVTRLAHVLRAVYPE